MPVKANGLPTCQTAPSGLQPYMKSLNVESTSTGNNSDWLVLLSVKRGDLAPGQDEGKVQARLAVNRNTGEVIHQTPGIPIEQWQAEIYGEVEEYFQRLEQRRTAPLDLSEWKQMGGPLRGIPRNRQS